MPLQAARWRQLSWYTGCSVMVHPCSIGRSELILRRRATRRIVSRNRPARMRHVTVLRLLTYNVRSLRDDDAAVGRVIRAANPHVACIQEAPRFFRWRSKCAGLARRAGMVLVTGGRDAGANLVLSTLGVDVVSTRDVLLSRNRGSPPAWGRDGSAPAGRRRVRRGRHASGRRVQVHQIGELHRALDAFAPPGRPAIVAGDINASPTMPGWQELAGRGSDAFAVAARATGSRPTSRR